MANDIYCTCLHWQKNGPDCLGPLENRLPFAVSLLEEWSYGEQACLENLGQLSEGPSHGNPFLRKVPEVHSVHCSPRRMESPIPVD